MIEVLDGQLICEPPVAYGERKGQSATGTEAGYSRHYRAGEKPCEACRMGYSAVQAGKRKPRKRQWVRRWDGRKPRPEPAGANLPNTRRSEPGFTGWKFVRCRCGARGRVNAALLKRGQAKVESCVNCR